MYFAPSVSQSVSHMCVPHSTQSHIKFSIALDLLFLWSKSMAAVLDNVTKLE